MKAAQQALGAARNNQTAIIKEWTDKPFTWHGCYQTTTRTRVLSDVYVVEDKMTSSRCPKICQDYQYSGTETAKECFCGNTMNGNPTRVSSADCMTACWGGGGEYCGGSLGVNIFTKKL